MSLILHAHPLSSFCWKVLIALHENAIPFEMQELNLGDETVRENFAKLSPLGKMPALEDQARGEVVYETSTILDYLDQYYPGPVSVPKDRAAARAMWLKDRFFDLYIHHPMQRIVADRLRAEKDRDPYSVAEQEHQLQAAYDVLERDLAGKTWATGESFSFADCAASPALFYADIAHPIGAHANVAAYLARLKARPAFARVLKAAEPYLEFFPLADRIKK